MDKVKEQSFVKSFIAKEKRERILFELCSPKKREQAIQKISGSLNDKNVAFSGATNGEQLYSFVSRLAGKMCQCYVISDGSDDGKTLSFDEAFSHLCDWGGVYVLLCGSTVAVVKEEYVSGSFYATVLKI